MRYARGKKLALYVCKGTNESYKHFKKMRGAMGNLTITENLTLKPYCDVIDPTFKWIRCYNMPPFAIFTGGEVLSRTGNIKSNRYHNRNVSGWIEIDGERGWEIKIKL
ncbi:hypothetical protein LKL87_26670 [Bacillus paranthracis]|uniref:hypothetical protein n=1 Tax=Bacillus paranthracis TaxID=2026186 RepID=UPI001E5726D7|nr:hypothetical protein [Bacillus paranthracis]MCC2436241.1 hypothetical protein [Bacillus paranthracis]